jgi:hypothetical protein
MGWAIFLQMHLVTLFFTRKVQFGNRTILQFKTSHERFRVRIFHATERNDSQLCIFTGNEKITLKLKLYEPSYERFTVLKSLNFEA